jgi:hypothetical protein
MKARRRKKRRAFRTIELEEDAARLGPFPRRRVPYDDITFIAAGTHRGWLGHDDSSEAHPLSVETRSGRVMTLQLRHSDADKALRALKARSPNAAAIDSEGHEHLPASGGACATAWWKALRRTRGHRGRVRRAQSALRASGQQPEA